HPSDTNVFTMKMEILLEPASNKLLVGCQEEVCDSMSLRTVVRIPLKGDEDNSGSWLWSDASRESPYRLAPQKARIVLWNNFKSCKMKVSYDLDHFRGELPVSFVKRRNMEFI
ncbi:hypothetical protein Tco_0365552, partial [Tanacetum coccineum]